MPVGTKVLHIVRKEIGLQVVLAAKSKLLLCAVDTHLFTERPEFLSEVRLVLEPIVELDTFEELAVGESFEGIDVAAEENRELRLAMLPNGDDRFVALHILGLRFCKTFENHEMLGLAIVLLELLRDSLAQLFGNNDAF